MLQSTGLQESDMPEELNHQHAKTTLRYHFSPIMLVKIYMYDNTLLMRMQTGTALLGENLTIPKKATLVLF